MIKIREAHNQTTSKIYLLGLIAHLPVFVFMSWYFKTQLWVAVGLSSLVISAPLVSWWKDSSHPRTHYFLAVAYIMFSGILIHLGKGMIEMHFHIFVSLAILSVFGYKGPVIAAAITAAVHHIGLWLLIPESVFNYDAGFEIVLLHALFVIVETFPAVYIAHKFGEFIGIQEEILDIQGEVTGELGAIAKENQESSRNLKTMANSLSLSSSDQASSIQETASALNEIRAMVHSANKNIQESDDIVTKGTEIATKSESILAELTEKMEGTQDSIEDLEHINELVSQIKSKTELINDIVLQTQLLSFNASIEAARAGAHGKGFSVVAEEVGNLAQSSGEASNEIEKLLQGSNEKIENIIEKVKSNIKEGKSKSDEVVENFKGLNSNFRMIAGSMKEIIVSNEECTRGINEVSTAIDKLSSSGEVIQGQTQKLDSFSDEITSKGEYLTKLVERVEERLKANLSQAEEKENQDLEGPTKDSESDFKMAS